MAGQRDCSKFALALAVGIILAVYILFTGITAWLFDWGTSLVEVISSLYIGYAASLSGAIIGTVWAFIDGFIAGLLIAWLYNKFLQKQL